MSRFGSMDSVRLLVLLALSNMAAQGAGQVTWRTKGGHFDGPLAFDPVTQRPALLLPAECSPSPLALREWDGDAWADLPGPPGVLPGLLGIDPTSNTLFALTMYGASGPVGCWRWDGAAWASAGVGPINGGSLVADTARRRVVAVGSFAGIFGTNTWEWDGAAWTFRGLFPVPALAGFGLAYDPIRGRTVLFGGQTLPMYGDTWEWDGTAWASRATSGPAPRVFPLMNFDPARGRVVLRGGSGANGWIPDAWEWNGTAWTLIAATSTPQGTAATYDLARQRVVLTGPDTWELAGTQWTQRTKDTSVTGLGGNCARDLWPLVYDSIRGRGVCFVSDRAQLYEWDGSAWNAPAVGLPRPTPRRLSASCFDSARGVTLVFGGLGVVPLSDTWAWNGSSWSRALPAAAPPGRSEHAMAFDSGRGRAVLFGGQDGVTRLNDVWEWDGTTWIQASPGGPAPRNRHAMAYDSRRGVSVLFGGDTDGGLDGATWEWNGSTWTQHVRAVSPVPRQLHTMTFDSSRGRVILFGGFDVNSSALSDVWEWDGTDWTERTASASPSPRAGALMAWQSHRGSAVLFGGFSKTTGAWLGDTWEYAVPCDSAGPGHQTGGLVAACTGSPALANRFCLSFPSAAGAGILLLDPGQCNSPPLAIDPPALCSRAFLYATPTIVLFAAGNPSSLCLDIPSDPVLAGSPFCLQGLALQAQSCFLATNGVAVTIGMP